MLCKLNTKSGFLRQLLWLIEICRLFAMRFSLKFPTKLELYPVAYEEDLLVQIKYQKCSNYGNWLLLVIVLKGVFSFDHIQGVDYIWGLGTQP